MADACPRVFAWWWLSVAKGFTSARVVAALSLLSGPVLSVLVVPAVVVGAAVAETRDGSGSRLASLVVDHPIDGDEASFSASQRAAIAAIPGVKDVSVDLQVTVSAGWSGTWDATMHVLRPSVLPPGIPADTTLTGNQVIVPQSVQGTDMTQYVGKDLPMEFTRGTGPSTGEGASGELRVIATYPKDWTGYGARAFLGSEEQVVALVAARFMQTPQEVLDRGVETLWVQADSSSAVDEVAAAIRAMGFEVTAERDALGGLPGMLALFPSLITVFGALTIVVLATQIVAALRAAVVRRKAEFGLLRMRGYTVGDLQRLLTLDVAAGAVAGAVPGVAIGLWGRAWVLGWLTPVDVRTARGLDAVIAGAPTAAGLAMLLAGGSLILASLVSRRLLRTDPFLLVVRD